MVRYRRNLIPGGTFFFTVTLADRSASLLTDNIASLRHAFRTTREERPFEIDAIVILPEHLHVLMSLPEGDADFPGRWRRIKSVFTRHVVALGVSATRSHRGEYGLWQRRYWEHTIRDQTDFARHFDYIHYNPAKHGWVMRAGDWPHSSFHRYVRSGLLPGDWAGAGEPEATAFGERME
ncbi:MAG TPA: transposase [Xanthobacteraceae bacterium]|jgi:putative transposase|nr:transposase [Xanthobacteraceae bacterium]